MSATHKARRRNLRTAVITAAVLSGISLPIGAAAAQPPTPPAATTLPAPLDSGTGTGDVDNGGTGNDWRPGGTDGTTDVDNAGRGQVRRVEAGSKQLPGGYVAHLYNNMKGSTVTGWEAEIHRVKTGGLATTLKATRTTVTAKADGRTFTLTPSGRVSASAPTAPGGKPDQPQDRIQPRTVKLRDGGTAKINWILGTPRADLFDRSGKPQGALERPGVSKTLPSGLKVTLRHGGHLVQEKTAKPTTAERYVNLRDGGIAKISKNGNGTFKATLHDRKDTQRAAIDSRTKPTAVLASGLKVTLTPGGNITQNWSKSRPADNAQLKLKLRDGTTALVEKGTDKVWGATLWSASHDAFLDGIHATKRPTVTLPSGLKITISKNGTVTQAYKGTTTHTPASVDAS
ncbi:hypothetical protein ACFWP3_36145 [Streptomyces sp. NPDC058525]|uniref:hypothetical protein n=1 Tax=Streptomyces sp. NPDC058525 TaxID=3346538 RepID=UPI00364A64DD